MAGGGGGYSGFQMTGMIKWGQNKKAEEIPRDSNKTLQNPTQNLTFQAHNFNPF